jgi:hypothetical protein
MYMADTCLEQNEDWYLAVEECIEKDPLYAEYKAECEAEEGWFGQQGLWPVPYCNPKASDGGEDCTDGSQCEGMCLSDEEPGTTGVVGTCTNYVHVFGCVNMVINGSVDYTLCID